MSASKIHYSLIKSIAGRYDNTPIPQHDYEFIFDFVQSHKSAIKASIETGFAYGFSAVCIMCACEEDSTHTVIDFGQSVHYLNKGVENVHELLPDKKELLKVIEERSFSALPKLLELNNKYDFCFVDGDHSFDDAFLDFYFLDKMLSIEGWILFHDMWMPSILKLCSYIDSNRSEYVRIGLPSHLSGHLALYQKKSTENNPEWDYFSQF